jgi:RNA polymerase sigma factor (sigma-70 family)
MRSASTVLLRTQSDARLVALASAGHDRAFEAIVERYRRPLLRACRRIVPDARAEDALQLALVSAWTAMRRGDDVRELRPWLYRIVRNTALNQLRAAGSDLDELVDTLAAAEDPALEVERRALVHRTLVAIAALPERQRDALLRTAIAGQGQDEVARDLGLSHTALRQLVHRARVSVRTAATAVVPWPLAAWLSAAGTRGEPRIAELVASAGAAGGTAWAAKAGAVAVIAGSAVTAPAVIDHPEDREAPATEAREEPAEVAAAEAAAEPALPAGGAHAVRAERDGTAPDHERIAAAGGPTRAREERREAEPHMVHRPPDVDHGGGEDPPVPAPVSSPAPVAPPAAVSAPTPTPTPDPAEAEAPASGPVPEEEPADDRPVEPADPPGDEGEAAEEPEPVAGEDPTAPSDP